MSGEDVVFLMCHFEKRGLQLGLEETVQIRQRLENGEFSAAMWVIYECTRSRLA